MFQKCSFCGVQQHSFFPPPVVSVMCNFHRYFLQQYMSQPCWSSMRPQHTEQTKELPQAGLQQSDHHSQKCLSLHQFIFEGHSSGTKSSFSFGVNLAVYCTLYKFRHKNEVLKFLYKLCFLK